MRRSEHKISNYRSVIVVDSMDRVPKRLGRNIYLIERGDTQRWVVLACPCGCDKRIEANLMRSKWPRWRVRRHRDRSLTLMPSLWRSERTAVVIFGSIAIKSFGSQTGPSVLKGCSELSINLKHGDKSKYYAAGRESCIRNGTISAFGALQAPATISCTLIKKGCCSAATLFFVLESPT
jgi:hypothetical protein